MNQSVDDVCRGEFEPVAVFEFVIECGADLEGHSVADLERRERCLAVLIGGWDLQCLNEPCQARYPWTVVDPVLFRGDREYDVGRVLWSRLDELPEDRDVFRAFDAFLDAADVPADRARAWVVVRSMSYLVWGLARGLTWDPPKCIRLLGLFS